jgi:ethanolamine ammonia-lyase large subunit
MLNYQSTSFHDALYLRRALNLRPAPEFESWLNGDRFRQLASEAANPGTAVLDSLLGKQLTA